jgi:site-specific recombinase XerD
MLTKRETGELLSAADPESILGLRDRAMLEVLYSTGIRVSELACLTLDDLDLRNAELKVRGKGKEERIVPLGEVVKDCLERYLAHSRPILAGSDERSLFVGTRGRRFHYTNISFILHNYGKRAGITKDFEDARSLAPAKAHGMLLPPPRHVTRTFVPRRCDVIYSLHHAFPGASVPRAAAH